MDNREHVARMEEIAQDSIDLAVHRGMMEAYIIIKENGTDKLEEILFGKKQSGKNE